VKASDFRVAAQVRQAAEGQLSFFHAMMAVKTAQKHNAAGTEARAGAKPKNREKKPK
jgi:hypothetical protein